MSDTDGTDRPTCKRAKCPYVAAKRGYCRKHYRAWCQTRPRVDARIVRAHVKLLEDAGFGPKVISQRTGVAAATICDIAHGRTRTTLARTATAILAFAPDADQPSRVNPVGVRRRLRALACHGFTDVQIADAIGIFQNNLNRYLHGRTQWVSYSLHDKVRRAYDAMIAQPAPTGYLADRARRHAESAGWLPHDVWDAEDLDDPSIDESQLRRPPTPKIGARIPEFFVDEYLDYRDHVGLSDQEIAKRFGISREALVRRLGKLGIPSQYQAAAEQVAS